MVNSLKQKSIYAYLIIAIIIILNSLTVILFIKEQKNSGKTINISGKQRMLIQRIALLSNNYFYNANKQDIKKKIQENLTELQNNQNYIQNLQNHIAKSILDGTVYTKALEDYITHTSNFLNTPTNKLLEIINHKNEALLVTSNTLTVLLAHDNDKKTQKILSIVSISTIIILSIIYIIYRRVTVVSLDETKKYMQLIDKNIITSLADLEGKIIEVSEAFCAISGYTKAQLIGNKYNILRHPDMDAKIYKNLWEHLTQNKVWSGELKNLKKDGTFYWLRASISPIYDFNSKKIGYREIGQDISDKKLIEILSITDGLTNIYNRRHFDAVFPTMLQANNRDKEYISFAILDVDHFKHYNDTYGHQKGDAVLIALAKSLQSSLKRQDDLCFRLGGEEFGAVFYSQSKEEALQYASTIKENIEALKIKHPTNSASKYVTVSMGLLCLKPNQVENADLIYKEADKLLYEAKKQGRNRIVVGA